VPYDTARAWIQTLDIGLVCGTNPIAREIQRLTESDYSHALKCGWCGSVLMAAESTRPESRIVTLSSRVADAPGRIDIYRLRPEVAACVDENRAWAWAKRAAGIDYPESEILADWREIVLGVDNDRPNSDCPTTRRVCSEMIHACLRVAGMAPIREFDCDVYPGTLADPGWVNYLYTLEA
jgi:hypothetical protein